MEVLGLLVVGTVLLSHLSYHCARDISFPVFEASIVIMAKQPCFLGEDAENPERNPLVWEARLAKFGRKSLTPVCMEGPHAELREEKGAKAETTLHLVRLTSGGGEPPGPGEIGMLLLFPCDLAAPPPPGHPVRQGPPMRATHNAQPEAAAVELADIATQELPCFSPTVEQIEEGHAERQT